ncbi:MAG: type I-F CRISPR-associated helicase Cas3f [Verrucomicrobiales bacterium]|nr:type I-F CRISPR-associated helicase Cas3f [Verrucomicrobiales bacterium]
MQVILISQCKKKALQRTRMVLDAFAERIGDNTWQTIITHEGLEALHTELRKTASKSTAVACLWQRSRTRSQLLWIVGKQHEFNATGQVPVNETGTETGQYMENERWKYLPLIKSLTSLAAIFHDWGKSNKFFQAKILKGGIVGDPHRHEWLSVLFLRALYNAYPENEDWLDQLKKGIFDEKKIRSSLKDEGSNSPFEAIDSNCLKLLLWLILSHHRMPLCELDYRGEHSESLDDTLTQITVDWDYSNVNDKSKDSDFDKCYSFSSDLLTNSPEWLVSVKKYAKELKTQLHLVEESISNGAYRSVLHHARLCLMLGDYNYSSQPENQEWISNLKLLANTNLDKTPRQRLDNHLYHVAKSARRIPRHLPIIEQDLPGVECKRFLKPSPEKYDWQDKAVKKILAKIGTGEEGKKGFFCVNLASTGCGKTIANSKIMAAASVNEPCGMRLSVALGLRTLTLQTGDEFKVRLGLKRNELGTIIGSTAVQELHELNKSEKDNFSTGSESRNDLFTGEIRFTGDFANKCFDVILEKEKQKMFLAAPITVCTIDHLMGATETTRGGRYILPSLRLLSSDLVIDEIDDFVGEDEIAIGRLIFQAGMLGKRVLLSSATIPPSMAEGYFQAYSQGWTLYQKSQNNCSMDIDCVWVDEFRAPRFESLQGFEQFQKRHNDFTNKRVLELDKLPPRRKGNVIPTPLDYPESDEEDTYFTAVLNECLAKHRDHHTIDTISDKSVSLGVVRVATIKTAVSLTQHLYNTPIPENWGIHIMTYHSRQLLLMRNKQEEYLDSILKRKENADGFLRNDETIRHHLDTGSPQQKNVCFIVIATPVEEVGRDHDFDWAVIEPSSFRSIIQMSGRVARHREITPEKPNIGILEYNINAYRGKDQNDEIYFRRPGYEVSAFKLANHSILSIVDNEALGEKIDATPRIRHNGERSTLIGIEHLAIESRLRSFDQRSPESLFGFVSGSWWLTGLPQTYCRFRRSAQSKILSLVYDPDSEKLFFSERLRGKFARLENGIPADQNGPLGITQTDFECQYPERTWLSRDYLIALKKLSEETGGGVMKLSEIYGEITVAHFDDKPRALNYNDQLGLYE